MLPTRSDEARDGAVLPAKVTPDQVVEAVDAMRRELEDIYYAALEAHIAAIVGTVEGRIAAARRYAERVGDMDAPRPSFRISQAQEAMRDLAGCVRDGRDAAVGLRRLAHEHRRLSALRAKRQQEEAGMPE